MEEDTLRKVEGPDGLNRFDFILKILPCQLCEMR